VQSLMPNCSKVACVFVGVGRSSTLWSTYGCGRMSLRT
jgi:hypothetical protein